jgi:hypothetical protein
VFGQNRARGLYQVGADLVNGRGQPKPAERPQEDLLAKVLRIVGIAYAAKSQVVDADHVVAVHGLPILIAPAVDHP